MSFSAFLSITLERQASAKCRIQGESPWFRRLIGPESALLWTVSDAAWFKIASNLLYPAEAATVISRTLIPTSTVIPASST